LGSVCRLLRGGKIVTAQLKSCDQGQGSGRVEVNKIPFVRAESQYRSTAEVEDIHL